MGKQTQSHWCLGGSGGMDYKDHYWGLYGDYSRDEFPHSLLSTREYSHWNQKVAGFHLEKPGRNYSET